MDGSGLSRQMLGAESVISTTLSWLQQVKDSSRTILKKDSNQGEILSTEKPFTGVFNEPGCHQSTPRPAHYWHTFSEVDCHLGRRKLGEKSIYSQIL